MKMSTNDENGWKRTVITTDSFGLRKAHENQQNSFCRMFQEHRKWAKWSAFAIKLLAHSAKWNISHMLVLMLGAFSHANFVYTSLTSQMSWHILRGQRWPFEEMIRVLHIFLLGNLNREQMQHHISSALDVLWFF